VHRKATLTPNVVKKLNTFISQHQSVNIFKSFRHRSFKDHLLAKPNSSLLLLLGWWSRHYLIDININFLFNFFEIVDLIFNAGLVKVVWSCRSSWPYIHKSRLLAISQNLVQEVLLVLIRFLFGNRSGWSRLCSLKWLLWLFCSLGACCINLNLWRYFLTRARSCWADLGRVEITGFRLLRDWCLNCLFFRFLKGLVPAVNVSAQLRLWHKFAAAVFVGTNKFRFFLRGFLLFLTKTTPFESGCPCFSNGWRLLFRGRWGRAATWDGWHFQI